MLKTLLFAFILFALCIPAVLAQPANPGQGQGQGPRYEAPAGQAASAPQGRPTAVPDGDRWPAFSMTYRETTATKDRSYRVDYMGPDHWVTTLVDNPGFPGMVGASTEYDGTAGVITFHNPMLGDYTEPVKPSVDPDGNVGRRSPNGWLLPDTHMDRVPDARVTRGQGVSTVVRQEGEAESHTTVRPDGIPTEHVIMSNGGEIYRATVLELTIH